MRMIPNHLNHKSIICMEGGMCNVRVLFCAPAQRIHHQAEHNKTSTMGCDEITEQPRNTHRGVRACTQREGNKDKEC